MKNRKPYTDLSRKFVDFDTKGYHCDTLIVLYFGLHIKSAADLLRMINNYETS